MNKREFLARLREALNGLPRNDIEECMTFYSEMIEDRIEEGISEEEAVSAMGTIEEIVAQTVVEIPLVKIAKERMKPRRRLNVWAVLLLAMGSPIWLSLIIAAAAVILSVYISLWSVIVSLWVVFVSLIGCAFAGLFAGIVFACSSSILSGAATFGAGLICAGLSIFMFYGCKAVTKGILLLTRKIAVWIKSCFIKKEAAQ